MKVTIRTTDNLLEAVNMLSDHLSLNQTAIYNKALVIGLNHLLEENGLEVQIEDDRVSKLSLEMAELRRKLADLKAQKDAIKPRKPRTRRATDISAPPQT